ncbi:MAG TPA: peptidoglycan-binding domain-containing protein, partial [Stenomitos sp.]
MGNVNQTSTRAAARPQTPPPSAQAQEQAPVDDSQALASAQGAASTEAAGKPSRGLLGHVADVFIGGGQAIGDMVKGVFNVIAHPIQTVKGIGYVVTHPASLVHAFIDPYKQAIAEGRPGLALGRGIVEIGSLFVGPTDIINGFKGAKGFLTGAKGASEAGQVTAKAGALGAKGAELSTKLTGQATAAMEKASALSALGHTGEAAKLEQFARIMQKSAGIAAQGTDEAVTRAMRYATMAANAQTVKVATTAGTQVMSMAGLVDHSNALLSAAAKATGEVAEGVAKTAPKAAKAAEAAATAGETAAKAVVATEPVLTKTAIRELASAGIKDSKVIRSALDEAAQVFATQKAAGATATAAKEAARAAAAAKLGLEPTATAVEKLVNGVRLQGAVANPANYFTRTRYVRPVLHDAAEVIGKPIDAGIVAGRQIAQDAAVVANEAGQKIAGAVQRIGDLQIRQIPHAIGTVATWPFRVTYNALSGAGQVLKNGLAGIADLPLRRIWEAPAEGVMRAVQAGAEVIGKIPDLTLGQIAAAPFAALSSPAGLLRPALALSVLGRLNGTKDMPADDASIAKKYGILGTAENVKAFKDEVASYPEGAIGPDAGTPEQVAQLQTILRKLGYDVQPSGTFDENTALAVIDFKKKNSITQGYKLADGTPAINEYVDEATAQAMVAALKGDAGAAGDASNLPKVSAEDVQKHLDELGKGFDTLKAAKTDADKTKAKTALEASAVTAISDLIAYAAANPADKAAVQTQLQEIGKAFQEAGYSDEQIQKLMDDAKAKLTQQMETTAQTKPAADAKPSSDVPNVTGKQIQDSLDALGKAFDGLRGAKTDADKTKAKAALEPAAKEAIYNLTAYGLKNTEARSDVEDQLNE